MTQYYLWKVSYTFEVPSDFAGGERVTESYVVVAKTPEEARKKGDTCLLQTQGFTDLYSSVDAAQSYIHEIKGQKIHFPDLLDSDKKKFTIQAKVSDDGKTLEFLVKEK